MGQPHGHWKTLSFLAGLRHDRIVAPCVIDGPIHGVSFTAWVGQFLVPTLRPGDIAIADNLGSDKGVTVRHAILSVGAKLFFLPAYSPDLNPIEMVFTKLKSRPPLQRASLVRSASAASPGATVRPQRRRFCPSGADAARPAQHPI